MSAYLDVILESSTIRPRGPSGTVNPAYTVHMAENSLKTVNKAPRPPSAIA